VEKGWAGGLTVGHVTWGCCALGSEHVYCLNYGQFLIRVSVRFSDVPVVLVV
jgi:hypothetical protein